MFQSTRLTWLKEWVVPLLQSIVAGVYLKRRGLVSIILHMFKGVCLSESIRLCTLKGGCLPYSTLLCYVRGVCRYSIVFHKRGSNSKTGVTLAYNTMQEEGAYVILFSYTLLHGGGKGHYYLLRYERAPTLKEGCVIARLTSLKGGGLFYPVLPDSIILQPFLFFSITPYMLKGVGAHVILLFQTIQMEGVTSRSYDLKAFPT